MKNDDLARQVVDHLHGLFDPESTDEPTEEANQLLDVVSAHFDRQRRSAVLRAFEDRPQPGPARSDLHYNLAQELAGDSDFRRAVSLILDGTGPERAVRMDQTAGRDAYASARDLSVDNRTDSRRTNFGGIFVALVAIAAIIALGFGAKAVYNSVRDSSGSDLDGSSTCSEFLQADSATQVDVMKRLYLAAGRPSRAGDPFILQNATYTCGQAPRMTLATMAAKY